VANGSPSPALWAPADERVRRTHLHAFSAFATTFGAPEGLDVARDYGQLHRWSIERPDQFWTALWSYAGVVADAAPASDGSEAMQWPDRPAPEGWPEHGFGPEYRPRWFAERRLNFAENLLQAPDEAVALVAWGEDGRQLELDFAALRAAVARFAAALRDLGIAPGDRVAAVLPNGVEAVIAALGTWTVGGVWSSCSPDFGAAAVVDRFGQIEPRVLLLADGTRYAGRAIDLNDRGLEIAGALPSVECVVHVAAGPSPAGWRERLDPDDAASRRHVSWHDFAGPAGATGPAGPGAADAPPLAGPGTTPDYERLPFDHPLAILYSSGTTGLPKAIVHSAGGTLLQHRKEHALHTDLHAGERLFYFTTCGWMMWNWLVTGLAEGAAIVLYDGSPMASPDILWQMAADERITHFGASARYFAQLEADGVRPRAGRDLAPLRSVLSTGSPLSPASFRWLYRELGPDLHVASISGGTDIVSCFALGNPAGPVREGELQVAGLGMAVEVHAPGQPGQHSPVGVPGELTCTRAFPSMPLRFWNDPGHTRFRAAYFEREPGVWSHGDWAEETPSGGFVIHGRSDATLNPGGVRVGTAEIYGPLDAVPEVLEAAAVGLPRPGGDGAGDVHIVLLVRLRDGVPLSADLEATIRARIRAAASPRHVPSRIVAVPDLPRTLSGKLSEIAVRDVLSGRTVTQREALANPESLDEIRALVGVRLAQPVADLTWGMIDYAGLFPPSLLSMDDAVAEYRRRALGPESGFLSRFVVPVARLDEFARTVQATPDDQVFWRLSAIVGPDPEADAEGLARFHASHGAWARAEAIEHRVADASAVERAVAAFSPDDGWELWLEVPRDEPARMYEVLDAIRARGVGAKIRTGGVIPDAFPTPEQLCDFIAACVDRGVVFKATAGLHHPLRGSYRLTYEPEAPRGVMFGYLNLLLATAVLRAGGSRADALAALVESDPDALQFDAGELAWRDFRFDVEVLRSLRTQGLAGFGSCSFTEPVDELGAILIR
jgi:acetoacetyl-CoA synthetase